MNFSKAFWVHYKVLQLQRNRFPPEAMMWQILVSGGVVSRAAASKLERGIHFTKSHYDIIKWKHLPRNWPFVRGIHRSPVNSPHKGQWRGALVFSLNCAWINGWVNNRQAGDLRRHGAHYDVKQWFLHYLISITIHFVRFQILFKR